MRIARNRKRVNRLYVLGAGASFAATQVRSTSGDQSVYQAPLDAQFSQRIAEVALQRPGWVGEARDRILRSWKHDSEFEDHGLERSILLHLGSLEFISAIHPRRAREMLPAHEWMNLVAHLICAILRRCRTNRADLYERFAKLVFPEGSKATSPNRVITFNYDTLFDQHLLTRFAVEDLYFDSIQPSRGVDTNWRQRNPMLLKLHGSSNWRCSAESFERIIEGPSGDSDAEPFEIPSVWVGGRDLPSPSDSASPLIIPPLPAKPIAGVKLFNYLWTRAFEYLHQAKEVIVIGYSLPDADQMAYSMFSSFRNDKLKRVVIVDPATDVLARWRGVLRRSGVANAEWSYHETFADYLEAEDA